MARDQIHYAVRNALENAGWTIIADPFRIESEKAKMEIDLEAERILAATKGKEQILIEIKSFTKSSILYTFYEAYGQYEFYRNALQDLEIDKQLFLAISDIAYERIKKIPFLLKRIEQHQIKIIIIDIDQEIIVEWKN